MGLGIPKRTVSGAFLFLILALAGCHRSPSPSPLAQCLAEVEQWKLKNYRSALQQAETCLALAKPEEKPLARARYLEVLSWRGEWQKILSEAIPPAAEPKIATLWRILHGLAAIRTGDFASGISMLQQARQQARQHQWHELEIRALLYLGGRGQNFDEETSYLRQALQLLDKTQNLQLKTSVYGQMGTQHLRAERCGEAVEWFERALEAAEQSNDIPNRARTLGNLGWCYLMLGETEFALALSQQAADLALRTDNIGDQIKWRNNCGVAAFLLNRHQLAAQFYHEAYRLIESSNRRTDAADCLINLATLHLALGDLEKATQAHQRAIEMLHPSDHRTRFFSDVTAANILLAAKQYPEAENRIRSLLQSKEAELYQHLGVRETYAELLAHTQRREQAAVQFETGLREALARASDLRREDFRLSYPATNLSLFRRYARFLLDAGRITDALWVADAARWSKFGDRAVPLRNVDPRTIASKRNAAILIYWLAPRRSSVWVVTADAVRHDELPGEDELGQLIEKHHANLRNSRQDPDTGQKLFQILVGDRLASSHTRVIVIGDGVLHRLSFDTLNPRPGRFWIEDVTLSRAPSLRSLLEASAPFPARAGKLLLVGNANLALSGFSPLPRVKEELASILNEMGPQNVVLLAEAQATPQGVLGSRLEQFDFIHFATHGVANNRTPLDSALILSPGQGDYRLTARQIVRQKLRARLVTLGVCHSAGVRAYRGTGLIGLGWAFLRAGAEGVTAGLWEIQDSASLHLHTTMYRFIRQGMPAPEALRQARLDLLRSNTPFRAAYYWGAWTFMEGRP
ncbi:MAG: CHAT domain-containing protein [Bryobacteraceae bacterium]|nr:CHAT domain-containing protein [Bryobacteraceae bacterium]MDW8379235.1 CHAT domain-containing tetratricopeptide repeat protein [Bryobacterales bacterium]